MQHLLHLVPVNSMTLAPRRNAAVWARANVFKQLPRGTRRCQFLRYLHTEVVTCQLPRVKQHVSIPHGAACNQ